MLLDQPGDIHASGSREVVGLVAAGGTGSRLAPLPFSKELFPLGFRKIRGQHSPKPKVVTHYLLEKFARAGIRKTFMVIRKGKWDIPAYFGDGQLVKMHVGYVLMREPFGPPFTLDQAYPFVRNHIVAFGFPDILFGPEDVFQRLLDHQKAARWDVVLGLYRAHDTRRMDMVDMEKNGTIRGLYLKPFKTDLHLAWICAVWTPVFTEFMHEFLRGYRKNVYSGQRTESTRSVKKQKDLPVGAVLKAAIRKGLRVSGVTFPKVKYLDVGTPENLFRAVQGYGTQISPHSL